MLLNVRSLFQIWQEAIRDREPSLGAAFPSNFESRLSGRLLRMELLTEHPSSSSEAMEKLSKALEAAEALSPATSPRGTLSKAKTQKRSASPERYL